MVNSSQELKQKAYPSAFSSEELTSELHHDNYRSFGSTVELPSSFESLSTEQKHTERSPFSASVAAMPVLSLDDVRDPALRDAFGATPAQPASSSQKIEAEVKTASPFEPSAAEQTHAGQATDFSLMGDTPVTSGLTQVNYPSADHTTAIPKASQKTSKKSASPKWMRSSLKSFVHADQSLTKPIRGLARLSQRQFALNKQPDVADRTDYVRQKEQAREILNFTLRLSETMFHYGADTIDVDSAIVTVCAAYGLDNVEVDITNQSVVINYVSDIDVIDDRTRAIGIEESSVTEYERFSHTVVRVVRSWSENYAALDEIYKLIYDITARGLSRARAERRLAKINEAKKPYSPMVLMLANIATASCLTMGIGGTWAAGVAAGLVFLAIHFMNMLIAQLSLPSFFNMAAGAGVVTFAAIYMSDESSIFSQLGINVAGPHIVAAGLIMLLPTSRLVSAFQDALHGFPLTSAGKLVSTGMAFIGIVVGLASAVGILAVIGTQELDTQQMVFDPASLWVNYIFMVGASVAIAITMHARWQTLLWVVVISSCGIATYNAFTAVMGAGAGRANTAAAAFVIGLLSTYLAYKKHSPAAMFYVPGLTFLLPGLSIFRGLYMFTVESNADTGVPGMVSAVGIVLSMASGVVLGNYIMQNVIQRFIMPRSSDFTATQEQNITQTLDR